MSGISIWMRMISFVGEDPFNAVSQTRLKQIKEAVQQAIGGVESMLEKL